MAEKPLLEVENLVKLYDGRAVVNRLSFCVQRGEIVGLLGRNGAGKTTTFRITVGMIDAEQGAVMRDLSRKERFEKAGHLIEQFGLVMQRSQLARTLSGGERRKLEIARALVTDPKLLMLDEPFSGVDPKTVEDLQQEILRLKRDRGIAILLTDHNVRETLRVTDRSYIINDGEKLAEGTPPEIVRDPVVRKTYLGSSFRGDEFDTPT